jgi:hypothetical protein
MWLLQRYLPSSPSLTTMTAGNARWWAPRFSLAGRLPYTIRVLSPEVIPSSMVTLYSIHGCATRASRCSSCGGYQSPRGTLCFPAPCAVASYKHRAGVSSSFSDELTGRPTLLRAQVRCDGDTATVDAGSRRARRRFARRGDVQPRSQVYQRYLMCRPEAFGCRRGRGQGNGTV